jgi:hypothetical protein
MDSSNDYDIMYLIVSIIILLTQHLYLVMLSTFIQLIDDKILNSLISKRLELNNNNEWWRGNLEQSL